MTNFRGIASLFVAATMTSALSAETKCPGNVESVPLHPVNGYQMIVAVEVNHSGPYNFLLDTGAQFTMIDPSLAAELGAKGEDSIPVNGTGFQSAALTTLVGPVEIGSHAVAHVAAVLFSLQNLKSVGLSIRGVLGEDFLKHFDMLIDNEHARLCLDERGAMKAEMVGLRVEMVTALDTEDLPPNSLLFAVQLSGLARPIRLKLDSGATASVLYNPARFLAGQLVRGGLRHGSGGDGVRRNFVALPAQNVKIGSVDLAAVPFFALASSEKDAGSEEDFDGLLSTGLFRWVFIARADSVAVLEAW